MPRQSAVAQHGCRRIPAFLFRSIPVQTGYSRVLIRSGGSLRVGQVLVMLEVYGNANFGAWIDGRGSCRRICRRLMDAQDFSPAADTHAVGEGDFCRHEERDFHFCSLLDVEVTVEINTTGAEVLGEAVVLFLSIGQVDRDGQGNAKTLRGAAFDLNRAGVHDRLTEWLRVVAILMRHRSAVQATSGNAEHKGLAD